MGMMSLSDDDKEELAASRDALAANSRADILKEENATVTAMLTGVTRDKTPPAKLQLSQLPGDDSLTVVDNSHDLLAYGDGKPREQMSPDSQYGSLGSQEWHKACRIETVPFMLRYYVVCQHTDNTPRYLTRDKIWKFRDVENSEADQFLFPSHLEAQMALRAAPIPYKFMAGGRHYVLARIHEKLSAIEDVNVLNRIEAILDANSCPPVAG